MKPTVKTCVIGSYPVTIDSMDIIHQYYNQKEITWNPYISSAVKDMLDAGIHSISDGQTRDPFIQIFTRKLQGCRVRDRTEIVDKIAYKNPITVNDQHYVKNMLPKDKELIGVLTGPYTLSQSCIDTFYNDEKQVAFDFAYALHEEAKALQQYVDMISIDEPFFSNNFPEYAQDLIEIIIKNIRCQTRLHVCGDVSSIIADLLEMPVDILSHEFKASPKLLDAFKQYSITKKICLGCVRSDDLSIESVEEIGRHIQKAQDVFGDYIVQIAPDCGQRLLPRDIAFMKLKNLVTAGETYYG